MIPEKDGTRRSKSIYRPPLIKRTVYDLRYMQPSLPDGLVRPMRSSAAADILRRIDRAASRKPYSIGFSTAACPPNTHRGISGGVPEPPGRTMLDGRGDRPFPTRKHFVHRYCRPKAPSTWPVPIQCIWTAATYRVPAQSL